jgi:hypothetical protein
MTEEQLSGLCKAAESYVLSKGWVNCGGGCGDRDYTDPRLLGKNPPVTTVNDRWSLITFTGDPESIIITNSPKLKRTKEVFLDKKYKPGYLYRVVGSKKSIVIDENVAMPYLNPFMDEFAKLVKFVDKVLEDYKEVDIWDVPLGWIDNGFNNDLVEKKLMEEIRGK